MNNTMAQYVLPLLEFVLSAAGVFALYLATASLKRFSTAVNAGAAWKQSFFVITYAICSACALTLAVALGEHGLAMLMLVLTLPLILIILSLVLASRASRRARRPAIEPGDEGETDLVVIRKVAPGRIRGFNQGDPVYLDDEDLAALVGAQGHVRLLAIPHEGPWSLGFEPPLFGFWNTEGTSILLYKEDELGVTGGAA